MGTIQAHNILKFILLKTGKHVAAKKNCVEFSASASVNPIELISDKI